MSDNIIQESQPDEAKDTVVVEDAKQTPPPLPSEVDKMRLQIARQSKELEKYKAAADKAAAAELTEMERVKKDLEEAQEKLRQAQAEQLQAKKESAVVSYIQSHYPGANTGVITRLVDYSLLPDDGLEEVGALVKIVQDAAPELFKTLAPVTRVLDAPVPAAAKSGVEASDEDAEAKRIAFFINKTRDQVIAG